MVRRKRVRRDSKRALFTKAIKMEKKIKKLTDKAREIQDSIDAKHQHFLQLNVEIEQLKSEMRGEHTKRRQQLTRKRIQTFNLKSTLNMIKTRGEVYIRSDEELDFVMRHYKRNEVMITVEPQTPALQKRLIVIRLMKAGGYAV